MLIDDEIEAAKQKGLLVPAKAVAPWAGEPRSFLMSKPLHEAIRAGADADDEKVRQRWARLEAAIGHFVEGGVVTQDLIKQLVPSKFEHWELRSRRPRPSMRVFGRFAKPDVFVGTHVVNRKLLGGMWSSEFEHEKLVCEDHYKAAGLTEYFSDPPKFIYTSYITENATKRVGVPR